MITAKALYASARLRSLPLSVSGVLLGSGAAYGAGAFKADIFALALLTTLLFQVLSDYGDAVKGTDDEGRLGPRRAIQTGQMSAEQMKRVIVATALLSALSSLALSVLAFGERFYLVLLFLALGGASIYAAIRYTVGVGAYGYKGLGDVFVFLFFGLLSVLGSYFLYARSLDAALLLPACACGMLSTAVLNLNNMRDIQKRLAQGQAHDPRSYRTARGQALPLRADRGRGGANALLLAFARRAGRKTTLHD